MSQPRFQLGQLLITPGALEALGASGQNPGQLLKRHLGGDWGDMSEDDRAANDQAIAHEGDPDQMSRVFSAYILDSGVKFWIITEADRSATTILLPEEY